MRVDRPNVLIGRLGEMIIGEGRIEVPSVAVDTFTHGAPECLFRPTAYPGRGIRRDVGRVDRAERGRQGQSTRKRSTARRSVANFAGAYACQRFTQEQFGRVELGTSGLFDRGYFRVHIGPDCCRSQDCDENGSNGKRYPGHVQVDFICKPIRSRSKRSVREQGRSRTRQAPSEPGIPDRSGPRPHPWKP